MNIKIHQMRNGMKTNFVCVVSGTKITPFTIYKVVYAFRNGIRQKYNFHFSVTDEQIIAFITKIKSEQTLTVDATLSTTEIITMLKKEQS